MRVPMKHIIALLVALFLLATRSDANAFVLIGPYNAAGALAWFFLPCQLSLAAILYTK
jgi:hypothetical protein